MNPPLLELAIERTINATPETVFRIWTERLAEWWCPKPWTTELVALELRPGGRFALVMRGPSGEAHPQEGVVLEVIPNRSVAFTDAFTTGWILQKPFMVAFFEFEPDGPRTRYRAGARHWDLASQKQHEQMGFTGGWTQVAAQLAMLAESPH